MKNPKTNPNSLSHKALPARKSKKNHLSLKNCQKEAKKCLTLMVQLVRFAAVYWDAAPALCLHLKQKIINPKKEIFKLKIRGNIRGF